MPQSKTDLYINLCLWNHQPKEKDEKWSDFHSTQKSAVWGTNLNSEENIGMWSYLHRSKEQLNQFYVVWKWD
jgi:hypothetical protein